MICAWNSLMDILPPWLRQEADKHGRELLQELRMRINAPPELVLSQQVKWLDRKVHKEDINFCINMASQYSPWASKSISNGYITAPGGHRIGICGETVFCDNIVSGIRSVRSICIRVARDFQGISNKITVDEKSILILGAPGWGKTTLLRDLARRISIDETVCVVDERGELFPEQFPCGKRMDVLTGCPKSIGLDMALRTMGPDRIVLDEITALEDADAVIRAVGCGVGILATAHASSVDDMKKRPIYRKLWESGVFESIVVLHPDRSYHKERICL